MYLNHVDITAVKIAGNTEVRPGDFLYLTVVGREKDRWIVQSGSQRWRVKSPRPLTVGAKLPAQSSITGGRLVFRVSLPAAPPGWKGELAAARRWDYPATQEGVLFIKALLRTGLSPHDPVIRQWFARYLKRGGKREGFPEPRLFIEAARKGLLREDGAPLVPESESSELWALFNHLPAQDPRNPRRESPSPSGAAPDGLHWVVLPFRYPAGEELLRCRLTLGLRRGREPEKAVLQIDSGGEAPYRFYFDRLPGGGYRCEVHMPPGADSREGGKKINTLMKKLRNLGIQIDDNVKESQSGDAFTPDAVSLAKRVASRV